MKGGRNRLEIPLFGQAVVRLTAVPATSFTLDRPAARLDQLENALPLTGSCENIPNGTPCVIDITVLPEGQTTEIRPRPDEANRKGSFVVGSDPKRFKILAPPPSGAGSDGPIVLDLFDDGLRGKGRLTVRIKPEIPHCNEGREEKIVIDFDNRVTMDVGRHPPDAPAWMGVPVTLAPGSTGAFLKLPLRLEIVEYEGELNPKPGGGAPREPFKPQGLKKVVGWEAGDRKAKIWRLGCADDGDAAEVRFLYPEPDEIAPYEFAWKVSAVLPDGSAKEALPFTGLAKEVKRPRVTEFRLSDSPEVARSEGEVPITGYRVSAHLTFDEFASGIHFPCAISLWRAVREGKEIRFERAEKGDAHFLYEAGESATVDLGVESAVDGLFAVLRFPDLPVPVARVVDCGDLPFFDEEDGGGSGIFSSALLALGVCSKEAKALRPKPSLLDLERVEQVMWKGQPVLKSRLQRVLNGNLVLSPKTQCPADVALSVQKALLALRVSVVAEGATATETGYGPKTNKAFGKFLCTWRGGALQNLMIDDHGASVEPAVFPLFEKPVDEITSDELNKLPVVPINGRAFEVLVTAVAESQP